MTVKGGTTAACAACKYQRRKCSSDCALAPYFPPDQPKMFEYVHRLFGVSFATKLLDEIKSQDDKDDAMTSIKYESKMRVTFPVLGCCAAIIHLQNQLASITQELANVRAAITKFKHPPINADSTDYQVGVANDLANPQQLQRPEPSSPDFCNEIGEEMSDNLATLSLVLDPAAADLDSIDAMMDSAGIRRYNDEECELRRFNCVNGSSLLVLDDATQTYYAQSEIEANDEFKFRNIFIENGENELVTNSFTSQNGNEVKQQLRGRNKIRGCIR